MMHPDTEKDFDELMKGKTIGTLTDDASNKTAPVFVNHEMEMPRLKAFINSHFTDNRVLLGMIDNSETAHDLWKSLERRLKQSLKL